MSNEKCACGCGSFVLSPPYTASGKNYASAYCILSLSKSCSFCGGYYGEDFDKEKHDYRCGCHFEALDR